MFVSIYNFITNDCLYLKTLKCQFEILTLILSVWYFVFNFNKLRFSIVY